MTGAVIAVVVKQPVLVIPLSLLSHFVLDMMPHFGLNLDVLERNKSRFAQTVVSADLLLLLPALIIVPILVDPVISGWLCFAAMIAAISPDFAWVYRFINEVRTKTFRPETRFNKIHRGIQRLERPWGLAIEVAYLVIISIILSKQV